MVPQTPRYANDFPGIGAFTASTGKVDDTQRRHKIDDIVQTNRTYLRLFLHLLHNEYVSCEEFVETGYIFGALLEREI